MEELIVEVLFVDNVWCQKQGWSFMLCTGMVGFGLRRNKGTAGKEHPALRIPLFPLWRLERYWRSSSVKLKGTACLQFKWCRTLVPLRPSEGGGVLFSSCSQISRKTKIPQHSIKDQPCFWHHTFSTNSSSTKSSSILCMTRRGGLYIRANFFHFVAIKTDLSWFVN